MESLVKPGKGTSSCDLDFLLLRTKQISRFRSFLSILWYSCLSYVFLVTKGSVLHIGASAGNIICVLSYSVRKFPTASDSRPEATMLHYLLAFSFTLPLLLFMCIRLPTPIDWSHTDIRASARFVALHHVSRAVLLLRPKQWPGIPFAWCHISFLNC